MCSFCRLRKSGSAVSLEGWRIATHSTSRREGTLRWNFPNFGSDVTESISVYTMDIGRRVRHCPPTLEYKRLRISHHLELFFPHHQPTSLSHHQSTDLPTTLLVYTFYTTFYNLHHELLRLLRYCHLHGPQCPGSVPSQRR